MFQNLSTGTIRKRKRGKASIPLEARREVDRPTFPQSRKDLTDAVGLPA
jgi:hypothetical protein